MFICKIKPLNKLVGPHESVGRATWLWFRRKYIRNKKKLLYIIILDLSTSEEIIKLFREIKASMWC